MKHRILHIITCTILVLSTNISDAQIYTQDAEGKTSIIAPGSSINLDAKKEALSINWNNWHSLAIDKKPMPLWGIAAYGANEEGFANILSEGNFVPTTRLNAFFGIRKHLVSDRSSHFEAEEKRILEELAPYQVKILVYGDYKKIGLDIINGSTSLDSSQKYRYRKEFRAIINTSDYRLEDYIGALAEASKKAREENPKDSVKADLFDEIAKKIKENSSQLALFTSEYISKTKELDKLLEQKKQYRDSTYDKNILFYINGGINSSVFRLYNNTLPGTLKDQVVKTPYTNGFIEAGVNFDIGARWLIGATFGYEKFTTFDSLDNSDVVLRTTTTNGNQSLIEDKKYTVYTGDFFKYDRLNIKFDALYFGKISNSSRYAWNVLYGRFFTPFGEKKPKGIFNLGTAFNFHKKDGKFLGGIYCEAIDVSNNMGADTDFAQRINIGIVATFSFGSIISYLDK